MLIYVAYENHSFHVGPGSDFGPSQMTAKLDDAVELVLLFVARILMPHNACGDRAARACLSSCEKS